MEAVQGGAWRVGEESREGKVLLFDEGRCNDASRSVGHIHLQI